MTENKCPHCGYCPHCGRSNQPTIAPWRIPNYPYYPPWYVPRPYVYPAAPYHSTIKATC